MVVLWILFAVIVVSAVAHVLEGLQINWSRFRSLPRRRAGHCGSLFVGNFIEMKALYQHRFNMLPSMTVIAGIDVSQAFEYIKQNYGDEVEEMYQQNQFDFEANETRFNITILVLRDCRMIELGTNYVEILHTSRQFGFANELVTALAAFRIAPQFEVAESLAPVQVAGFMRQTELN